ncbi:hypothetical protein BC830DRAFT_1135220 [Chytriomyces sp. MP71]|nr:hypothetical protein BC830DRAFT_1135220 [Chytriomyces sp. MP71]
MTKDRREVGIERMGTYMLSGWVLTNAACARPGCNLPTFRSKDHSCIGVCCLCDDDRDPIPPFESDKEMAGADAMNHDQEHDEPEEEGENDARPPPQLRSDSDAASARMGQKLLQGWTMLATVCTRCNVTPLMEKAGVTICVSCPPARTATTTATTHAPSPIPIPAQQPSKYAKTGLAPSAKVSTAAVTSHVASVVGNHDASDMEEDDEEFWNELLESAPPSKYTVLAPPSSKHGHHAAASPVLSSLSTRMTSLSQALSSVPSTNYGESKAVCEAIKACAEAVEACRRAGM